MIDKDKLRQLASNPENTTMDVLKGLGFNNYATFSYHLKKDPEAQKVFDDARFESAAGGSSEADEGSTVRETSSARAPRRSSKRKTASAPPRKTHTNGSNGKGRISDSLLRRIAHEFEHLELYEQMTDHFHDVAEELRKAL